MQGSKRIPITDLNSHITCKICNGYFIDATTIIECLHTFCRSCIVKYLENNKYCPVCDVQVHKTKPLLNIRPDKTIQDIVYKLVPRLFQNETRRRKEFYDGQPEAKPSSLEVNNEAAYQHLLTPEETVCLTLSYHGANNTLRYLRCPAAVSLGHLKKLIRAKYDLTDNHRVEILHNQDCLNESLTLMDVAYIYLWKRKGPIELTYRIYECTAKKLRLEQDNADAQSNNNNNWKEVQLRISESGEMSITGIQDAALSPSLLEIVNSDQQKYKNDLVAVVEVKSPNKSASSKKELPGLKYIGKNNNTSSSTTAKKTNTDKPTTEPVPSTSSSSLVSVNAETSAAVETTVSTVVAIGCSTNCASLSSATTTTVFTTINNTKCSTKSDEPLKPDAASAKPMEVDKPEPALVTNNVVEKNLKRKNDSTSEEEPAVKLPKPTILNHSLGLSNLSNNHPLKKHSNKLNRNGENVKEIVLRSSTPSEQSVTAPPAPMTKPLTITSRTVTVTTTTDAVLSKPSILNKSLALGQSVQIMTSKPCIMSTKPSIIPPKPSMSVYSVAKSPCYMPKTTYNPVINVPKPVSSCVVKNDSKCLNAVKNEGKSSATIVKSAGPSMPKLDGKAGNATSSQPQQQIINLNSKIGIKSKPSTPIGYKTLRDPPKSWNSQISKANISKPPPDPKYSELKNVRPAKFFKMRNNMPRYLGNPASGVKPMYQVHVSPDKDKAQTQEANKPEKSEIRKHSIVKIDPKTLKPISEKAPETTSLSNHTTSNSSTNLNSATGQNDLKINTSSVSIFNPLKLQSSPKERKSPKSPHSPKLRAQAAGSPTGNKRDKVNLNFTPPNPFVPNLTSPTINPNQFLYPTGPPGFPPYDPRMMAAYHSLWYGQRMGFPASPMPRLSLDINQQRKNFEMMPSPTSPKTAGLNQPGHSPQLLTKLASPSKTQHVTAKSSTAAKKSSKELKSDKSLETTVEKLTQNRTKEITSGKSEAQQNVAKTENATKRLESAEAVDKPKGKDSPPPPREPPVSNCNSTKAQIQREENKSDEAKPSNGDVHVEDKGAAQPPPPPLPPVAKTDEVGASTNGEGSSSNNNSSVKKSSCTENDAASGTERSKDLSNNVSSDVKSSEVVESGGIK